MDTSSQIQESKPKKSLSLFAASFSLFVSSSAAVVALVSLALLRFSLISPSPENIHYFLAVLLFAFLSSLLMGIASLFGILRHSARPILWRALIGITVSLLFGLLSCLIWYATFIIP